MKNKSPFILIFFALLAFFSCDDDESIWKALIREGIVEGSEHTFNTVEGSDRFIAKYDLNDDEIKMIGLWAFDGIVCDVPKGRRYGPGLCITFYPNRIFKVHRDNVRNMNQIRAIFGEWRVINKKLQVRFNAKLLLGDQSEKNKYNQYSVEYIQPSDYYTIFKVPRYKVAYFNKVPFDWSGIPSDVMTYFEFEDNDSPRSRLLFDPLGIMPGDISNTGKIGILLFCSYINDKNYLIDLLDVW